jgi:electron transport complex protein RnfD
LVKDAVRVLGDPNATQVQLDLAESAIQQLNSAETLKSLFFGQVGGCIGETSAFLLLLGAAFLLIRGHIDWRIPLSYLSSVAVLTGILYPLGVTRVTPLFHILAGGLILGAFFMATDMVTSPVTRRGRWIFGIGCGVITVVIRTWGGYPEGVSYSILLMNVFTPLIDRATRPKKFGQ